MPACVHVCVSIFNSLKTGHARFGSCLLLTNIKRQTGRVPTVCAQGKGPERRMEGGRPQPGASVVGPYPPAVHYDGAGAASIALVHFPAMRGGCEGQRPPAGKKETINHTASCDCTLAFLLSHLVASTEQCENWRESSGLVAKDHS